MDRNGEFLLEFKLSNIKSFFEHKFKINQSIFTATKMAKLETTYFGFDQYDWSLSVYPAGRAESQLGKFFYIKAKKVNRKHSIVATKYYY